MFTPVETASGFTLQLGEGATTMTPNARIAAVLRRVECLPATPGSVLVGARSQPQGLIFVERNRVCWAAATGLNQRLCDILRDHGGMQVSNADLKTVYERCRSENTPIGEELVKRGIVTPSQLRASLHQHTAESMLYIDNTLAASGTGDWPLTWLDRFDNSHHPRFTFATSDVLAAVGAAQVDRATADVMADHLSQLGGMSCSAIAFTIDSQGAPVLLSVSMTATLFVDEALTLARWAHAALGACGGFGSEMIRSIVQSTATGGALAWTYEDSLYAAIMPNATSVQRLVSFVEKQALPLVLSTKLPLLQQLRERGVGI